MSPSLASSQVSKKAKKKAKIKQTIEKEKRKFNKTNTKGTKRTEFVLFCPTTP